MRDVDIDDETTIELIINPELLAAATGFEWRPDRCSKYEREIRAYQCFPGGRICRVSLALPSEGKILDPIVVWEATEILRHPEGGRSGADSVPSLVLRRCDTAETVEEAACLALAYKSECREMAGRLWYADGELRYGRDFERPERLGWICPVAGEEVDLRPASEGDGWAYSYPCVALEPRLYALAEMFSSKTFRGEAPTLEEAAIAALSAPTRFRQLLLKVFHETAGGDLYAQGVADGRTALFAEIASIVNSKPAAQPEERMS